MSGITVCFNSMFIQNPSKPLQNLNPNPELTQKFLSYFVSCNIHVEHNYSVHLYISRRSIHCKEMNEDGLDYPADRTIELFILLDSLEQRSLREGICKFCYSLWHNCD